MAVTGSLSSEDIDDLGRKSFTADDPIAIANTLVAAVDHDRLADPNDISYTLILAAEIHYRHERYDDAEELARRAATASDSPGYPHAFHAQTLLALGRDTEGLNTLTPLRPRLLDDAAARDYVIESLRATGYHEIAEEWLTTALAAARDHRDTLGDTDDIVYHLIRARARVRADSGQEPDADDQLADAMATELHAREQHHRTRPRTVLFWPELEYHRLLERWPTVGPPDGPTWEEHRDSVAAQLRDGTGLCHASFASWFAFTTGRAPDDDQLRDRYIQHILAQTPTTPFPPAATDDCWCGSGRSYALCCAGRSEGLNM